ncbi:hypothetical protein OBBRIDRAFT_748415 [Obba rivulosa]|uniref:Uncharacterized protein n=1 Tax=Obba rivulosa TaxID=1052685 RepID=A0A8E2DR34_9APHY|nr:hypothetical protein OBBRIDRAFT_748415 [Obba rivulosa]
MQSAASATAKYQFALPFALSPVSPGLAALCACRARAAYPAETTLSTSHCSHCGVPFHVGGGSIRVVRLRRPKAGSSKGGDSEHPPRVLRRSCEACGHVEDMRVERGNASSFPPPQRARHAKSSTPSIPDRVKLAAAPSKSAGMHGQSQPEPSTRLAPLQTVLAAASPPSLKPTPPPIGSAGSRSSTPGPIAEATRTKTRPKKKSGLQDLLARNRQRQEEDKKADGHGLSAFLQGLS